MKKIIYAISILFSLGLVTHAFAQPCSMNILSSQSISCSGDNVTLTAQLNGPGLFLDASNTAGNNHRGNMFDIVATNDVTILSFDASPMGNTTIEIYYKVGTWNGFANTPSAWTYIGSAPVPYTGGFSAVAVPVNVTIPAGQTYGFYVTSNTAAVSLNYSNGVNVGNIYSSDANITFLEGGGMEYPFTANTGAVYQPRVWNGRIHYALANVPGTTYLWGAGETTASINPPMIATSQYTVVGNTPGCPPDLSDSLTMVVSIPAVNAGIDQTLCLGDSVMLNGTGAESYVWDNGVNDSVYFMPVGTLPYVVTGTDSVGCLDTDTVTVQVNPLPIVEAGTDYSICSGDSTTLAGSGANSYTWDNGVTDNTPFQPTNTNIYIVTGIDLNGCENTDDIEVTVNPSPPVSAGPDEETCSNTLFTLNGSGAVNYTWNNGITDGVAFAPVTGSYIVTGTDGLGCTNTDTMELIAHLLDASIVHVGNTLLTASLPDVTIQWVNCPGYTPIAGETIFGFSPSVEGSYAVILTNTITGCVDTADCELVEFIGIEENLDDELSVYPVPTDGMVTVASTGAIIRRIELTDMVGKILFISEPNAAHTQIDLSELAPSTFFVRIYRDGHTALMKIMKN